jgi:UDP-glucuronate 4-epimerase
MPHTILVTGAAGFIGSHTAEALLARGHRVVGLDDLNPYYAPSRKQANLAAIESADSGGAFHFVQGDVRDKALLRALFEQYDFGTVVHLAAMAGVRASISEPHLYYDVNLTGTLNLLEMSREVKLANFVFASTSSVYGNTPAQPFSEDNPCDRPLAPYSASKRAAELMGFAYHHLHGQNFTGLRFFTVYGPRGRPDMMAHKLLQSVVSGLEIPFYGGNMKRDWTFIGDIVFGVVAAAEKPLGYELINLGRGEQVSLTDFVQHVEALAGRKANLLSLPKPAADVFETEADISKARRLLGYDPKTSVREGILQLWQWYQTERSVGRE